MVTYEPPPILQPGEVPAFARRAPFESDRYLYHYTRWERLLDIAHGQALRLSPVTTMNDPKESKRWLVSQSTFSRTTPKNTLRGAWEAMEEYRRHVKVAAFATDTPGDSDADVRFGAGYARPRMWAQYSANHTGACIVFDRAELLKRFAEQFGMGSDHSAARATGNTVR
jgi:hypothetical protein